MIQIATKISPIVPLAMPNHPKHFIEICYNVLTKGPTEQDKTKPFLGGGDNKKNCIYLHLCDERTEAFSLLK